MSSRLERIEGPECGRCGCQDSEIVSNSTRWGQTVQRRRCSNCGASWTAIVGRPKARKPKSDRNDTAAAILRLLKIASERKDGGS